MHTLLLPGEVHKSEKSNNCYEKLIVGASSEYKSVFQTLLNLACMSVAGLQWRDNAAAAGDGCVTIRQYAGPGPGLGPGPDTYTGAAQTESKLYWTRAPI